MMNMFLSEDDPVPWRIWFSVTYFLQLQGSDRVILSMYLLFDALQNTHPGAIKYSTYTETYLFLAWVSFLCCVKYYYIFFPLNRFLVFFLCILNLAMYIFCTCIMHYYVEINIILCFIYQNLFLVLLLRISNKAMYSVLV